jgi:hypothetical protein
MPQLSILEIQWRRRRAATVLEGPEDLLPTVHIEGNWAVPSKVELGQMREEEDLPAPFGELRREIAVKVDSLYKNADRLKGKVDDSLEEKFDSLRVEETSDHPKDELTNHAKLIKQLHETVAFGRKMLVSFLLNSTSERSKDLFT